FGLGRKTIESYVSHNVWTSDVARFGIDIWMTTQAIAHGFKVCQANLGMKVHDPKDPASSLGPMFRQVVWTLFTLMEQHFPVWKDVHGSQPVDTFGAQGLSEPEPIKVNQELLMQDFKLGFQHFGATWKQILFPESYVTVERLAGMDAKGFVLPASGWAHILYETAATFHRWSKDRAKLVDIISPLYEARVASFINETTDMTTAESERVIEDQAEVFEQEKSYLLNVWDAGEKEPQAEGILQKGLGV
ncbi:MAG TPA: cell wall biosynthesis glycosyltransferase, partial [Candidatus Udaeobacter sp.]|nr:cell wall biosynthesis glycosyltransferase [Candidatus Udaeobacter sp.]